MSYIGQRPVVGRYIKLDQISSGFNGSNTGFSMTAGSQAVFPGTARNLLLSLGGVIQEPDTDFTISGSTLTFTTAPVANTTFFGVIYGDMQSTGTPSDGTVLPASIASSGNFSFPQLTVTSSASLLGGVVFNENGADVDFRVEGDTDANLLFVDASAEKVGIGASSLQAKLHVESSTNYVDIALRNTTSGSSGTDGVDIFLNNNLELGLWNREAGPIRFATSSTERMRIDSSGNVGIGTSSPAEKLDIDGNIKLPDNGTVHFGVSDTAFVRGKDSTDGYVLIGTNGAIAARFDTAKTLRMNECPTLDATAGSINITGGGSGGRIAIQGTSTSAGAGLAEMFAFWGTNKVAGMIALSGSDTTNKDDGHLTFLTSSAGPAVTERMRITSGGDVGIGITSPARGPLHIHESSGTANIHITNNDTGTGTQDGATLFVADTSAGLWYRENGPLRFAANNSEKMRIDSSGRVGIGMDNHNSYNSVADDLIIAQESGHCGITIRSGTTHLGGIFFTDAADTGFRGGVRYDHNGDYMRIDTNLAERMRIDSSGKLMVGGTTADAKFAVIDSSNPDIAMRYNGTSGGHNTRLMFMDKRGVINAQIANNLQDDGVGTAAAHLQFATSTGGTLSTQMTIDRNGKVSIGDNLYTGHAGNFQVVHTGGGNQTGDTLCHFETNANDWIFQLENNEGAGTAHFVYFRKDGNNPGSITATSSNVSYNTSPSDRDLKKNFESWTEDTLSLFKNINPQKFNFNFEDDSTEKTKGFIAQDMLDKFPEAYPNDRDGFYKFNPSGMVVYLMKALQEEITKREALESRVAALEAA